MAVTCNYGLYFANGADGIAAQAANGGSLILTMSPEIALATYPLGVVVQVQDPVFYGVPGYILPEFLDANFTVANGPYTPPFMQTYALTTIITQVPTGHTVTATWTGTIIFTAPGLVPTPAAPTGKFELQVVQYTGDGTSARAIATSFALDSGVVAIWICGGPATDDLNCFRHNNASMGGTYVMSDTTLHAANGIMSFTSTGFTVTAGLVAGITYANGNTRKYTAIVMRDSTSDNRYLRVGTYTGVGAGGTVLNVQAGSPAVSGTGFLSGYNGILMADISQGTGSYTFVYQGSSTNALISPPFAGTTGAINVTFTADDRPVAVPGLATPVTHVWVWGRGVAYRSTDFTGDSSVSCSVEAYPVTNVIQALGIGTFTIGTENNVNTNAREYDFMTLNVDDSFIAQHLFASWKVTGTASPPIVKSGLGFTPAVAFGRQYTVGGTGAIWKGPDHVGTDSNYCGSGGGFSNDPAQGIPAIGSGTVSFGTDIAPNGIDGYGWAFAGGSITLAPTYTIPFEDSVTFTGASVAFGAREGAGLPINAGPSWALQRLDIKASTQEHQ